MEEATKLFESEFRKTWADLSYVAVKLEADYGSKYDMHDKSGLNPMRILKRIKKLQDDIPKLREELETVMIQKHMLMDACHRNLSQNRSKILRFQQQLGQNPISDDADQVYRDFLAIKNAYGNQVADVTGGKAGHGSHDAHYHLLHATLASAEVTSNTKIATTDQAHTPRDARETPEEATSATQTMRTKRAPPAIATDHDFHAQLKLTREDFDTVPIKEKGKLSFEKIDKAILEISSLFQSKYSLLNLPKSKITQAQAQKIKHYRDQESMQTKGTFFLSEQDLVHAGQSRVDTSLRIALRILCNKKRIREDGSSAPMRYILEHPQ
eukprot:TRINITY_DN4170_c0_g1_i3.p1 TRINITY_DN4170_c0_g1~~TRINITY_DN4170_c0_g1_i3.p1  ORF type:complete len:325 (+),score=70.23 TRINITY_DN4170_c0_g1_i3:52-1026(+)